MADRVIELTETGPDPKILIANPRDWIEFVNSTSHDVDLILDNPDVFSPSPGRSIAIADGERWTGHIDDTKEKCRYSYDAPSKQSAIRTGTIEVG